MRFTLMERILGNLPPARRYWLRRISGALNGAHSQNLIDSWTLHAIDAKAKYHDDPASRYYTDRALAAERSER